jgi:hypothetical protein
VSRKGIAKGQPGCPVYQCARSAALCFSTPIISLFSSRAAGVCQQWDGFEMVSQTHSPAQTCTLPSFQELWDGISSSKYESPQQSFNPNGPQTSQYNQTGQDPYRPAKCSTSTLSRYCCPLSLCRAAPFGFATWEQCVGHIKLQHPQLFGPLYTEVALQSDSNNGVSLPSSPRQGTPETPAPSQEDFGSSPDTRLDPVSMGWFDPTTQRAKATINHVKSWSPDELYHAFWVTDPLRCLYGDQTTVKKTSSSKSSSDPEHSAFTLKQQREQKSKINHSANERNRRGRHFEYQWELHLQTPETAHRLADHDKQLLSLKNSASSKGPGKDDQFVSDIYMHLLSAVVVQNEHKIRTGLERKVEALEHENCQLRQGNVVVPPRRGSGESHYPSEPSSPTKRQRISGAFNLSESAWKGRSLRLPPSPSPSIASAKTQFELLNRHVSVAAASRDQKLISK